MDFFTKGKDHYANFSLPLVYSEEAIIPEPDDGYYAILCAERGFITIEESRGTFRYPAPLAMFVRPGHAIRNLGAGAGRVVCCVFRPEAINSTIFAGAPTRNLGDLRDFFFFAPFAILPESGYSVRALHSSLLGTVSWIGKNLEENLNGGQGPNWPCMSRSYFLELLIMLERCMRNSQAAPGVELAASSDPMDEIREFIGSAYATGLSLESLASRFATNRTTLNKRFNAAYGMSAMAYVNSVRMAVAASLLRNTELSVVEIASRAGFSDESYFARAFRKEHSVSPGAFRKSCPNPYS